MGVRTRARHEPRHGEFIGPGQAGADSELVGHYVQGQLLRGRHRRRDGPRYRAWLGRRAGLADRWGWDGAGASWAGVRCGRPTSTGIVVFSTGALVARSPAMVAGTGAVIAGAAVVSDGNASEADGGAARGRRSPAPTARAARLGCRRHPAHRGHTGPRCPSRRAVHRPRRSLGARRRRGARGEPWSRTGTGHPPGQAGDAAPPRNRP
jgi:hypothetical protein